MALWVLILFCTANGRVKVLDILVLFSAVLLAYVYFRSHGGERLNIKTEFAPSSTLQGKRDRIIGWSVLAVVAAEVVCVFLHQQAEGRWKSRGRLWKSRESRGRSSKSVNQCQFTQWSASWYFSSLNMSRCSSYSAVNCI